MEEPGIISALLGFLDTLPASFAKGSREQMAVRELVWRLMEARELPIDVASFKTLIAPIVCSSPDQQREFYDRFDEWVAPKQEAGLEHAKRRRWPALVAAATVLLIAGFLSSVAYYRFLFGPIPLVEPPHPPGPPQPDGTPGAGSLTIEDRVNGTVYTPDGLPARNATIRIPFGVRPSQYPQVTTDKNGRFDIALTSVASRLVSRRSLVFTQPETVMCVVFSPDGRRLVTGSTNATARVWDLATGHEILSLSHKNAVWGLAFSPDGRRLATASLDKTAKVWNADTGQELLALRGHERGVWSVAFSPDGRKLATGSEDGTAKIWDAAKGVELRTLQPAEDWITRVAFSPDGRRLAMAGRDGMARIADVATGQIVVTFHQELGVWGVAFSPDGKRLATSGFDKTARVWDVATGRELLTLRGHTDTVYGVVFSPDGSKLATAGGDNNAKIWDAATGRELLTLRGHTAYLDDIAYSPDGTELATASRDGTARVWNATTGQPVVSQDSASKSVAPAPFNLLVTHPDYEPAFVERVSPGPLNPVRLGALKAGRRVLRQVAITPPQKRLYPVWVSVAFAMIPLCAAILFFQQRRKRDHERKAFLEKFETHLDLTPVRVHTRSQEEELFQSPNVSALALELRRRRPEPTSYIAVEPTIRRTAERAGIFTPVRLERHGAREYLVLLESKGVNDHQAHLWTCLMDRLAARDVWLDQYLFSGDPRVCEDPRAEHAWIQLEEIAALHPSHELWVVAEAERFFHRTSRQAAPWLAGLARWTDRAVLQLTDGTTEDRDQLEHLGFTVAPASIVGIAGLNAQAVREPAESMAAPYPLVLEDDDSRWLQGPAPKGKAGMRELRSLDRQLRAWLGSDGYRCLLACAVYPGVAWNLTLHLALALIPEEGREDALARLARLPWFRYGRMPQWLRAFFMRKLDPADSSRVMGLLERFLDNKRQQQARRTAPLEFVKITEHLRTQRKPPTRDYVFLSYLLRRRARLQALEAPGWLRHLLYPEGLPVLGVRRELWVVLGVLASVFAGYCAERLARPRPHAYRFEWRETTPPVPGPMQPVSTLSARAIEIAASRLGQPVDPDFVSWSFDRATDFSTVRGAPMGSPARPGTVFRSSDRPAALVESVVEGGGLILLEPYEGHLRRVFRPIDESSAHFDAMSVPERTERGTNSWRVYFSDGRAFQLVMGDIINFKADAIVNTTNPQLKNGGAGVDAAIHAAGGPGLQKELDAIAPKYKGKAPVGTVAVTTAGNLPGRFVFHVVSPVYGGSGSDPVAPLASCYRNLFQEATNRKTSSISFPAISTGANGYPLDIAVPVELKAVLEQLQNPDSPVRVISFVLFDANAFQVHVQAAMTRFATPKQECAILEFTCGTWTLHDALDMGKGGKNWSNSTLNFTSQSPVSEGLVLEGFFEWRLNNVPVGRENVSGRYVAASRQVILEGREVTQYPKSNNKNLPWAKIVVGSYSAILSEDGRSLLNGTWGSATTIPGKWWASR